MSAFRDMIERFAQPGVVQSIWLRAERLVEPKSVLAAELETDGLVGDHARPGKRAVTQVQAEHLAVIGAMLGQGAVDPAVVRRNLVVGNPP